MGSRVSQGLFDSYTLPNGKHVHYHYSDGSVVNEQEITKLDIPARPTSIPTALQEGMPLTQILDVVAKPPGSGVQTEPYRAVPRWVPFPEKHTLPVKHPDRFEMETFGDLCESNLRLWIQTREIQETRTTMSVEKIDMIQKEPWSIHSSIFKPRLREADSKDFYNTPTALYSQFSSSVICFR